jgi:hypothetical protein
VFVEGEVRLKDAHYLENRAGFSTNEISRIGRLVAENERKLLVNWDEFFHD